MNFIYVYFGMGVNDNKDIAINIHAYCNPSLLYFAMGLIEK